MARILMLISPLVIGLFGTAAQSGATVSLGPDPVLGGGEYSTGGGITVAVELRNRNGRAALCGVWAESERLTVYLRRDGGAVLSKGSIMLGSEVLTHDLGFLQQVSPRASYAGATAGCTRIGRAWQPADRAQPLRVRIPRRELRFGGFGRDGGGLRIRFRDTGRANPALVAGSLLPRPWTSVGD